jgi:hypothetical protein
MKPQRSVAAFETDGVARGLVLRERAELLDDGLLILLRPRLPECGLAQQGREDPQGMLRQSMAHDALPPLGWLFDRPGRFAAASSAGYRSRRTTTSIADGLAK